MNRRVDDLQRKKAQPAEERTLFNCRSWRCPLKADEKNIPSLSMLFRCCAAALVSSSHTHFPFLKRSVFSQTRRSSLLGCEFPGRRINSPGRSLFLHADALFSARDVWLFLGEKRYISCSSNLQVCVELCGRKEEDEKGIYRRRMSLFRGRIYVVA